jgi:hypothetical protein
MFYIIAATFPVYSEEITIGQIFNKNIAAAGGKEKLDGLNSTSIEIFTRGFFIKAYTQGNNLMKMVSGIPPIIQTITVTKDSTVDRKTFEPGLNLLEREKCFYLSFEKLLTGAFTLKNFEGELTYAGIKKFGPEVHYILETRVKNCPIQFNIDTQTSLIKRMVIEDKSEENADYKATYDFLPTAEMAGFNIPAGWYESDLGVGATAEGAQYELKNFTVNPQIEKDFFTRMELNMGTITAVPGSIKGNLTASRYNPDGAYGYFSTNVLPNEIKKTGFTVKDKISIKFGDTELEGTVFSSTNDIGPNEAAPGNVLFLNFSGSSYYGILMFGEQFKPLFSDFQPLKEFTVRKK